MGFLDQFGEQQGTIATSLLGLLAHEGGHAESPEAAQSNPHALVGGLGELISRFRQNGLGDLAHSWVSDGDNQTPTPEDVHQSLGSGLVDKLSDRVGIKKETLLPILASFLPNLVDTMTPNQRLPEAHEASHFLASDDERQIET